MKIRKPSYGKTVPASKVLPGCCFSIDSYLGVDEPVYMAMGLDSDDDKCLVRAVDLQEGEVAIWGYDFDVTPLQCEVIVMQPTGRRAGDPNRTRRGRVTL